MLGILLGIALQTNVYLTDENCDILNVALLSDELSELVEGAREIHLASSPDGPVVLDGVHWNCELPRGIEFPGNVNLLDSENVVLLIARQPILSDANANISIRTDWSKLPGRHNRWVETLRLLLQRDADGNWQVTGSQVDMNEEFWPQH